MLAAWTPEQWILLITGIVTAIGGQAAILIKLVKGDKKTIDTANDLAVKVEDNTSAVASSQRLLEIRVTEVLDELKHQRARLEGSIAVRRELTRQVDGHELRLGAHEQRLTSAEAELVRLAKVHPPDDATGPPLIQNKEDSQ